MAKPKINFNPKDFLLRRGEMVVMGTAGFCLLVLLMWGVSKGTSAEDPNKTARELAERADRVNKKIGDRAKPAPEEKKAIEPAEFIVKEQINRPASTRDFPALGTYFDPTAQPSTKRDNPIVFNVEDYQVDLTRSAMPGFDIVTGDKGLEIAMIATKKKGELDKDKLKEVNQRIGEIGKRKGPTAPKVTAPQPNPMGGGSGESGVAGGSPYGTGSGAFDPNGRRDATFNVITYESLGDYDKKVAEGLVPAITVIPVRLVTIHAVVPYKKQLQEMSRALRIPIPAPVYATVKDPQTGQPVTVVKNRDEIAAAEAELRKYGPFYDGFEIQRREVRYDASGKDIGKWADLPRDPRDTTGNYKFEEKYVDKIDTRKIGDHIDEGYLPYFLRPDMMLSMPLPLLAPELGVKYRVRYQTKGITAEEQKDLDDLRKLNDELTKLNEERKEKKLPPVPLVPIDFHPDYPGLRLKPILDNIRKLEAANREVLTASATLERLQKNRPRSALYNPQANLVSGTGLDGGTAGGFGGGRPPAAMPGKDGGKGPGPMGSGPGPMGGAAAAPVEIENYLLRFVDCDVEPGRTYEYRVRLRMINPNFGLKDQVAQEVFAGEDYRILYSKWRQLSTPITVPAESFLYAFDTKKYAEEVEKQFAGKKDLLTRFQLKDNQAAVQMATWMEAVRADSSGQREPIGSWVVTEVPVGRGEYVGRKQYVKLPLWSSEKRSYVLREVAAKDKAAPNKKDKPLELPKGWLVNFSTNSVLVDFDGGRVKTASRVSFDKDGNTVLNTDSRTVTEDVYPDLLILRQDGKLVIRSSRRDGADETRKGIIEAWTEWLSRVKEDSTTVDPMGKDPFGPKGGKGP